MRGFPPRGVIGVAGGTGSGKTSFARAVADRVGAEKVAILSKDAYYHDPSHLPLEERALINYDHPRAYDGEFLLSHLDALKRGERIPMLAYDFVSHARVILDGDLEPKPIVLLEGILILEDQRLRGRLDIKIFIDTDADVRRLRPLETRCSRARPHSRMRHPTVPRDRPPDASGVHGALEAIRRSHNPPGGGESRWRSIW